MTREDTSAALAQERHDADNALVWSRIRAEETDPVAYALCLCHDGAHHHTERLGWVTTHEAAWSEHGYYPESDPIPVHVVRRTISIELAS